MGRVSVVKERLFVSPEVIIHASNFLKGPAFWFSNEIYFS